jgi:acetyltransferase-like isoleucine patch superfamily enzyme
MNNFQFDMLQNMRYCFNIATEGPQQLDIIVNKLNIIDAIKRTITGSTLLEQLDDYEMFTETDKLPSWFNENNHKVFLPKAAKKNVPIINQHPGLPLTRDSILYLNGMTNYNIRLWNSGNFLYLSPRSSLPSSTIAIGAGLVYVGDGVRSGGQTVINVRNSGSAVLSHDILISEGCKIMSDDCHSIIDTQTQKRINPFGGAVTLQKHVWLGFQSTIMGNSIIGQDNIIGERAFVRNMYSPKNCILAGVPAKVIRTGVTWDQADRDDW